MREEAAVQAVDQVHTTASALLLFLPKVFSRCFSDLEPIGRMLRDMEDMNLAEREKFLFGYS